MEKNSTLVKADRDSRFELIRILAMLGVLAGHCNTFAFSFKEEFLPWPFSVNYAFAMATSLLCHTSNWFFILLTCWFSVGRVSFKAKRLLKILWQIWTTCVLSVLLAVLLGLDTVNIKTVALELITPLSTQYWYATAMVVFIIILPLLQSLEQHLDNDRLIVVCVLLILIRPIRSIFTAMLAGEICDFILGFFLVCYLKRNPDNWFKKHYKAGILLVLAMTAVLILGKALLPQKLFGFTLFSKSGGLFPALIHKLSKRSLHQLILAVCLFYAIMNLNLRSSRFINVLAKYTFGVYLWHYNYVFREIIWKNLLHANYAYTRSNLYGVFIILAPMLVFAACSAVEWARSRVLDDWLYPRLPWNSRLEALIDRHYHW